MKPNKTAEEVLKMARIGLRNWCFAVHDEGYVTLGVYSTTYKDGERDGLSEGWRENGVKSFSENYKDGIMCESIRI